MALAPAEIHVYQNGKFIGSSVVRLKVIGNLPILTCNMTLSRFRLRSGKIRVRAYDKNGGIVTPDADVYNRFNHTRVTYSCA